MSVKNSENYTMFKAFIKHNSSLIRLILCNTIVLMFVASLLSYILYTSFTKRYKNSIIQYNEKILFQMKESTDTYLLKYNESLAINCLFRLSQEELLNSFLNKKSQQSTDLMEIYLILKEIKSSNNTIYDVSLYSLEQNTLISTTGVKFLHDNKNDDLYNIDFIYELTKDNKNRGWLWIPNISKAKVFETIQNHNLITFVQGYPFASNKDQVKGFFYVSINEVKLNEMITANFPISSPDYEFMILNDEGIVISSNKKYNVGKNRSKEVYVSKIMNSRNNDFFIDNVNGVETAINYIQSNRASWTYVITMPYNDIYNWKDVLELTLISIAAVSCLGFILIYFFNNRFYIFIKSLESFVIKNKNPLEKIYLNDLITTKTLKNTENSKILNKNNHDHDQDMMFFKYKYFYTILIQSTYNEIIVDLINKYKVDNAKILYPFKTYNNEILVIVNQDDQDDYLKTLFLKQLHKWLSERQDDKLIFSVSSTKTDISELSSCYLQTKDAIKYTFIILDEPIITFEKIASIQPHKITNSFRFDLVNELIHQIKTNQFDIVISTIDSIINSLYEFNYAEEQIKDSIIFVASCLIKLIYEIDTSKTSIIAEDLIISFSNIENINEFKEQLVEICNKLIEFQIKKLGGNHSELIKKSLQFIKENLSNDISLALVAEKLGISESYLSKVFKTETGEKFVDYFKSIKLEYAKELLTTSKLSIDAVSQKVGYRQTQYFIKKFKEKYGLTPKQYKNRFFGEEENTE